MDTQETDTESVPWNIGARVRMYRSRAGWTLRELTEQTKALDPDGGVGILPAQLSRIENGNATCDVRELYLLARAFRISQEALLGTKDIPWEATRREVWDTPLARCHDPAHPVMSTAGLYRYAALDTTLALSLMQPYLFRVSAYDMAQMTLEAHEGEETLWVIHGELEFWVQQPHLSDTPPIRTFLAAGDSLQFSSRLLHAFRATGRDAYALAVLVRARGSIPAPHEMIVTLDEKP